MPHKKPPKSLRYLCIGATVSLLHCLNDCSLPTNFAWFLKENNPFRCFPGLWIQEILTELGKRIRNDKNKAVKKEIVKLLLCRNIDRLDLSAVRINENELADVLNLIKPFASNIQNFCIFFENIGLNTRTEFIETIQKTHVYHTLMELGSSMTNLTHLYLLNICFDEYLDVIAKNCPYLIVLRALSEFITDEGLKSLCINVKNPEDTVLRCQKLQKISLDPRAEGVSPSGIKLLLFHLPQLIEIEGCVIGYVLELVHEKDYTVNPTIYNLTHYMHDWSESRNDPLLAADITIKMCPFITTLKLLEPDDDVLIKFGNLKYLTKVTIISYSNRTTFENGVLPLLQQAGTNIVKLSLILRNIDLYAIDYFCSNLKSLDCNRIEEILDSQFFTTTTPFKNLEDLVFHANSLTTLTPINIKVLLSYCVDLQCLYISGCSSFTDELLLEIMQTNPLRKLRYLHLMYVKNLNGLGLEQLVNQENDLERIWLFDEVGNYKTALRSIKNQIREKNLDLIINDDP